LPYDNFVATRGACELGLLACSIGDSVMHCAGARSHGGRDPLLELLLGRRADLTRCHLAVLEDHQGRDGLDACFRGGWRVRVAVELDDFHFAVEGTRDLLERRRNLAARAAPFGPK